MAIARKANAKKAKAKPTKAKPKRKPSARQRLERESIREGERARQEHERQLARRRARAAERKLEQAGLELGEKARRTRKRREEARRRAVPRSLAEHLFDCLEHMRATSPVGCALKAEQAPAGTRMWAVLGEFIFDEPPTYLDLHEVFFTWEYDIPLEVMIDPTRLTMIRVNYQPRRGRDEWYTLSSATSWSWAISQARHHCSPDDEDSKANKYPDTEVLSVVAYLSENDQHDKAIAF